MSCLTNQTSVGDDLPRGSAALRVGKVTAYILSPVNRGVGGRWEVGGDRISDGLHESNEWADTFSGRIHDSRDMADDALVLLT